MNKKVVVLGGGTGMSNLLSGLKKYPLDITAIVSVCDDGKSTGILREEFNIPAVGDIRRVLVALSETEPLKWAPRQTAIWSHSCKRQWFGRRTKGHEGTISGNLSIDGMHHADSENKADLQAISPATDRWHSLGWFSFCYPLLTSHSDISAFNRESP